MIKQQQRHQVESYGVGGHVKLPGPSADQPNVYEFGTPYETIKADLEGKNPELYTRNGLLKMLMRNINTKRAPERWQDTKCVVVHDSSTAWPCSLACSHTL